MTEGTKTTVEQVNQARGGLKATLRPPTLAQLIEQAHKEAAIEDR